LPRPDASPTVRRRRAQLRRDDRRRRGRAPAPRAALGGEHEAGRERERHDARDGPGGLGGWPDLVLPRTKQAGGSPFDRAGLTDGGPSVAAVAGAATDAAFRSVYGKGEPARFTLASVDWDQSGADMNAEAKSKGISLNRIEDGHWDPSHPDDFYFLTTERGDKTVVEPGVGRDGGGLWRLRFDDIEQPELGGTLTLLSTGPRRRS
jgi:hypothetical protein